MTTGLYQLIIRLDEGATIRVGRLGAFRFPRGYYVYTGSARSGLEQRVARHLRRDKRLHWHIDYLLARGSVTQVLVYPGAGSECALNRAVEALPGGEVVVRGFGSSDCRCRAHLHFFARPPDLSPAAFA